MWTTLTTAWNKAKYWIIARAAKAEDFDFVFDKGNWVFGGVDITDKVAKACVTQNENNIKKKR